MLPVIFVSHGATGFALDPCRARSALTAFADTLPKLEAIVVLSPHWQSQVLWLSSASAPETIHDFSRFPSVLYQLQYLTVGAPGIATQLQQHLQQQGFTAGLNPQRCLGHSVCILLRYMFSQADISVIQLSLLVRWSSHKLYKLGQTLANFSSHQILFNDSGNLTHNIYGFNAYAHKPVAA
jgi:4,5-DOPA dioxygenase extradiol